MESRTEAHVQQMEEKSVEQRVDEQLRAQGLYRKKIAKDGSCLFRAVAEQVLHCQSLHTRVRAECVKYLRQKRDLYESFIEGDFDEYLLMLQDPQSWVGQVEISALSVLYKHDFIIYQQPGEPPVNITQNGYPDQVLLCFLNGNHYDSVYKISSIKSAAICQSILYELLYDRVYGVDRNVLTPSLRVSKAKNETVEMVERESSGDSDLDEGEDFWSRDATARAAGVNNRTAYKGRGRGQARGVGRGCLLPKVQDSLSPTLFRNVEYEVWLRSKRVQQRKDFCMAAGMHYKAGDKCQVRLDNSDRFYSAYIQDVSPDDGPVAVFIEELGKKHSVPLWNLRTHSEDSWSTVTEKCKRQTTSSNNGPTERNTKLGKKPMRSVSHCPTTASGSAPGNQALQQQHSWPPSTESQSLAKNGSSRRSDQGAGGSCVSPVEENEQVLLIKDEENFPTLEASAQVASVEGSKGAEKKGSRKKDSTDTKKQSLNPIQKVERGKQAKKTSVDQYQRISPQPTEETNSVPSATLPAPSALKSTKAAHALTTAPARVPYKTSSSLSTRIPPIQSETAPASSTRPLGSFQTNPIQSPTASAPSTKPTASFQTTSVQSPTAIGPSDSLHTIPIRLQTAPAPTTRPLNSTHTNLMQSPTAPAQSAKPLVLCANTLIEDQTALDPSEVIPASSHTTLVQPQTLSMPTTSVPVPVLTHCFPTQSLTVPKHIPVTTTLVPENSSHLLQPQVLEPSSLLNTPVPLNPVPDSISTSVSLTKTTIPSSPALPSFNPVATPLSSSSSPAATHALSQTTSVTTEAPVLAPFQIICAAEVPGSTDFSTASKSPAQLASEQSESAGVPSLVHVSHSITTPAQPSSSLAPTYPVGFGSHLPYPSYPPYPAPMPSLSPNISAPMSDPCLPPVVPTPPISHAGESYLYEPVDSPFSGAGSSALSPQLPSHQSVTLAQLRQDLLYPGFPRNEKDEPVQPPPFSYQNNDLPNDTSVLRFFFNLGVKAYMYQTLPPFIYLSPLLQDYHHMQFKVSPSPVSWQPDNSRQICPPLNPSPVGSTPVSHFEVRGVVRTPSPMEVGVFAPHSIPMQIPLPIASHPTVYAGMHSVPPVGPSLQYSAPLSSVRLQHLSVPPSQPYGMEVPTVPPIVEGGQGGQNILAPQVEKTFCTGQDQQHLEGRDFKPGSVPVTVEIQQNSGAQAVLSSNVPSKGAELTMLANGNRPDTCSGFIGSSMEDWETQKTEFGQTDLKSGQTYRSQSYKSGGGHGQDDRGGYRGRGSRGRRDYTGWGRHDGQLPYHRGRGRGQGRGYYNNRATGYPGGQFAPES